MDLNVAKGFVAPYRQVEQLVRPERATSPDRAPGDWWLFRRTAAKMRNAIEGLDHVIVVALVSKAVVPVRVPNNQVFSHKLGVFADSSLGSLALLSSTLHWWWAVNYGSTLGSGVNYSVTDVFETFPRPRLSDELVELGSQLEALRGAALRGGNLGITALSNVLNDPSVDSEKSPSIGALRELQVRMDRAVLESYGWSDIELRYGFHDFRGMRRWTPDPHVRGEILDRLLEENHRRAALQATAQVSPRKEGHVAGQSDLEEALF
jgi:hypothetical protein